MKPTLSQITIFLKNKVNYFFSPVISIFDYSTAKCIQSSPEKRIVETIIPADYPENLILTTYFNSKANPQNKPNVAVDDFSYIENFYNSVREHRLFAVIFYDNLSTEFIKLYSCENIRFVKCKILQYSLNDERFFIYQEFLNCVSANKILMCDVNDVTFGEDPFTFIKKNIFYIGRDHHQLTNHSQWLHEKISILPLDLQKKIPALFFTMPLVNAGVIGGDNKVINDFLYKITRLLSYVDNDKNNNMVCVNILFFDSYWVNYCKSLRVKIKYFRPTDLKKLADTATIRSKYFYMGKPFVSRFWKFEKNNGSYVYHK